MTYELEKYIQSYFGIPKNDVERIISFFRKEELKKNDFFLKADSYSDRLGFIESGIVREFLNADGKEVTKWISSPGYFVVDLASFLFDKPARWNLQALTDCELHVICKSDYDKIGQLVPAWQELEKLFIARCFTILEERIVTHLSLTAEARYEMFFQFAPGLFNQVPLQYLASMLGMTPETFSRIRKKLAEKTS
ncbi:MAG: Crp/Fnr family transcriptional regulator [Bacteroidia bacterium]